MATPIPPSDLDERELKIWRALRQQISEDIAIALAYNGRISIFEHGSVFIYTKPVENEVWQNVFYERPRGRTRIERRLNQKDANGVYTTITSEYSIPFSLKELRKLASDILENIQNAD